eukprot:CAMPEP_0175835548 /NCGR_PEP_ID=MMETSP0107_2-20121207/16654_1 /TAXON_ID=195067 ORGANISM="Goniomonas pacifica, Strain CCMP1869" /NCGR_SAMPLE_ID=MMETSP0107_2 /ASSEMBLY_ACC=CAM_ASM_000203 /LENGTH=145 /DNA_ID=CAMNT_0017148855 /DNA_START=64 /DNA_END=501 /DNA_ORIENTATION=-
MEVGWRVFETIGIRNGSTASLEVTALHSLLDFEEPPSERHPLWGLGPRVQSLSGSRVSAQTATFMRTTAVGCSPMVLLLVPHRELDDEMRVGENVREGPMTVEVRCGGVSVGVLMAVREQYLACSSLHPCVECWCRGDMTRATWR